MTQAKLLWSIWQALLAPFACAFSRRGYRRFFEWITAMAINVEEHTVTQSVLALDRPADWKAMESFAEYGAWQGDNVTWSLTQLIEKAPGRIWYGYHVSAVDDTKVHRSGADVWVGEHAWKHAWTCTARLRLWLSLDVHCKSGLLHAWLRDYDACPRVASLSSRGFFVLAWLLFTTTLETGTRGHALQERAREDMHCKAGTRGHALQSRGHPGDAS